MKTYTFWAEEILAITAGQLQMFKHKKGATQEFIYFCLGRINHYISEENANIIFKAESPNVRIMNLHCMPNEIVYYYDEKAGMYFANKSLLYKVLAHLATAELRIVDAIHKQKSMLPDWHEQNKAERMLKVAFEDTLKVFK